MLRRFKILIGLSVFLMIGLILIQSPLLQPIQSIAQTPPTDTPVPTETPIPTDTPTPTPTPYFFACSGRTCTRVEGREPDGGDILCSEYEEDQTCYNSWNPYSDWNCDTDYPYCGTGDKYRNCQCAPVSQCCPDCSYGTTCGSNYFPSSNDCCVDQSPNPPIITKITDNYNQVIYHKTPPYAPDINELTKLQTKIVTIEWDFNDTGDGCGLSWGFLCNSTYTIGNTDSFIVRMSGDHIDLSKDTRSYTNSGDLLINNGGTTIQVCANNGKDSIESCDSVTVGKAIPTGYIAGYLGEYDGDTGVSYGVNGGTSLALYANGPWLTPPPYIKTNCTITTASRYITPKPNTPIAAPKPIGLSYACTITYDGDEYFNLHNTDIPVDELTKKFYLGPASSIAYDNKLYCVAPTPKTGAAYDFDNCKICLGQTGCTETEAMSCSDIEPTIEVPSFKLDPTPKLYWTSEGNCSEDTFTGDMKFKQNILPAEPTPDVIRYKNIVFQINQYNTFFKQKNTAFQSHLTIENHFPASIKPFSPDITIDDGNPYTIIGVTDGTTDSSDTQYSHLSGTGLILSTINNGSAYISKLGWNAANPSTTRINANDYYAYTKARKKYSTITNIDATQIKNRGCYIYNGAFNYTDQFIPPYPIVFISNNTITIEQDISPSSSIIFIAPKIVFNNDVTSAKGVFIGNEIRLVSETNTANPSDLDYLTTIVDKPLLITGNLVSLNTSIKYWQRKLIDNRKPSLFVKFDAKQYTDGMPCLGVSKYKWNQLQ